MADEGIEQGFIVGKYAGKDIIDDIDFVLIKQGAVDEGALKAAITSIIGVEADIGRKAGGQHLAAGWFFATRKGNNLQLLPNIRNPMPFRQFYP